ncbi:MAG TPA: hypothetical protein VFP84_37425 [Kofleriaceae bacterium]|nr:hypothetical protein [Kofleriaceae bacterium]
MRSRVLLSGLVIGAWGCGFQSKPADGPPTDPVDASQPAPPVDAPPGQPPPIDGPPTACTTFSSLTDTCKLALTTDVTFSAPVTYDTAGPTISGAQNVPRMMLKLGGVDTEVILAHNITISAGLRATGAKPLAIIASGTVTIGNSVVLDLSNGGAGGRPSCPGGPAPGQDDAGGAAGGGGGGFGGAGGRGGNGNGNRGGSNGGAGGAAATMPTGLQGGCPGATGGRSAGGMSAAPAGLPGGALYIAAAGSISLGDQAVINAGGGGGRRSGFTEGGGSGGGAGGMIFLESPTITGATAVLAANGGGGGGGNDTSTQIVGKDGSAGLGSTSAAPGGGGANASTPGGNGGALGHTAGNDVPGNPDGGAGGGGGGCGFIRVLSANQNIVTSSPAMVTQ